MIEIRKNNEKVIIILHEIYGVNQFIKEVCVNYREMGFDVFCPEMYEKNFF